MSQPPRDTQSAGPADPPLRHVLEANQARLAALRAEDAQLARSSLREVVADLEVLLDAASSAVWSSHNSQDRKQVKKIVRQDLAATTVSAVPFREIADLLNVPPDELDRVWRSLRVRGAVETGTRDDALRQIRFLRGQLQLAAATEDHSLLDRLVGFVVKIAQALVIATTATATGLVVIGERLVDSLLVKAAVIALVTVTLQNAAAAIQERRDRTNPYTVTREALADLTTELARSATAGGKPAYASEPAVTRTRLLVKVWKVQQALLDIEWADKAVCWNALGDLTQHLSHAYTPNADELRRSLGKLQAVQAQIPAK